MDKTKNGENGQWAFKPGDDRSVAATEPQGKPALAAKETTQGVISETTWTASEYIAHHKGLGWYALLFLAAAVLAAAVYLFAKDIISTVGIGVIAIIFAVAAARKPRVLTYRLDEAGLTIGQKFYPYSNFKSFALVQEGAFTSITFMPLKRFMPSLSVYFAPDDEQKITTVLAQHLPMEQSSGELVDRLMHRIRF